MHYVHKTNLQPVALLLQQFPVQLCSNDLKMSLAYLYQWDRIALELEETKTSDGDRNFSAFLLGSRQDQSETKRKRRKGTFKQLNYTIYVFMVLQVCAYAVCSQNVYP